MTSLTTGETATSTTLLQDSNFTCPSGNNCTSRCYTYDNCGTSNSAETSFAYNVKKMCKSNKNSNIQDSNNNNNSYNTCNNNNNSEKSNFEVEEAHIVQEVTVGRRKRSLSIDKVKGAVFKRPKDWKTNEISMIEIRKHNTVDDVWIIAKNKVYNATPFMKIHPGGYKSIMRRAGGVKDCEEDFNFHSTNGRKVWQKYQIGIIEGTGKSSCQIM